MSSDMEQKMQDQIEGAIAQHEMKDDGGAAFPFAAEYGHPAACGGMTLRDYLAAQSIPAIIRQCYSDNLKGLSQVQYFAKTAYEIADAMLAERKKQ